LRCNKADAWVEVRSRMVSELSILQMVRGSLLSNHMVAFTSSRLSSISPLCHCAHYATNHLELEECRDVFYFNDFMIDIMLSQCK